MSVLYCTIPHFAAELARRDNSELAGQPLVLVGPEGRVLGVSAEATTSGVFAGMTAHEASVRCPEARLLDADVARCRTESETLLELLEQASSHVEPHGWGAAYVELPVLADPWMQPQGRRAPRPWGGARGLRRPRDELKGQADAIALLQELGRSVRQELGEALQPALGCLYWTSGQGDGSKFTAQAAARHTQPGHLRAVDHPRQRAFLEPLPVTLLPLAEDTLRRLRFLGLRTLGQYAALSPAAVWQQFGRAGKLAHRCARGEDDRPVVARWQSPQLTAEVEFEMPLVERQRLVAALQHTVSPLLAELRERLQACGQVRLTVEFDDGSVQECKRTFLLPVADEGRVVGTLGQLLDGLRWTLPATGLTVALEQVQDVVPEQLTLFPLQDEETAKLQQVRRYLAARFGANSLRRAVLTQPGAPLPEWRTGWLDEGTP